MRPTPSHSAQREQTNVKYSKKFFEKLIEDVGERSGGPGLNLVSTCTLLLARSVLAGL